MASSRSGGPETAPRICTDPDIRFIDGILDSWRGLLGKDFQGYRNHVVRVAGFGLLLQSCDEVAKRKISIAACYHDIGIWAERTFDYIGPSVREAEAYLRRNALGAWSEEIALMISGHHDLRPAKGGVLIEAFRRADLVDLSLGLVRFGLPRAAVRAMMATYPNAGFHKSLLASAAAWFVRHPGNPLPMVKW